MIVDQSRQHTAALEIDEPCPWSRKSQDLFGLANMREAAITYGDRISHRFAAVKGRELTLIEDRLGT